MAVTISGDGTITGLDPENVGLGNWTTYTPSLLASTTNPSLGTSAVTEGRYMQLGKLIVFQFSIQFGISSSAGNGQYQLTLPVAAADVTAPRASIGQTHLFDSSTAHSRGNFFAEVLATGDKVRFLGENPQTAYGRVQVSHVEPWSWSDADQIRGTIVYEAA